jgi:hypothetical protein
LIETFQARTFDYVLVSSIGSNHADARNIREQILPIFSSGWQHPASPGGPGYVFGNGDQASEAAFEQPTPLTFRAVVYLLNVAKLLDRRQACDGICSVKFVDARAARFR